MSIEDDLAALRPTTKPNVYDLLHKLRFDLKPWAIYKKPGKSPKANPKYCYNWSFRDKRGIVACIWLAEIWIEEEQIVSRNNVSGDPAGLNPRAKSNWKRRARELDGNLQFAYLNKIPVRIIVLDGNRRDRHDPSAESSKPKAKLLDERAWAVTQYDFATGDYLLTRGVSPVIPLRDERDEIEMSYHEGEPRRNYRTHRHREWRARAAKIAEFKSLHGGRLFCQVPRCEFDFHKRYGAIGEDYAHVHHLKPLGEAAGPVKTMLSELAVVCANCHAMIHIGGKCHEMDTLIADALPEPVVV